MSGAFSVFRPSLSLLRLGSLLFFKFSALAAPLRRSCSALILAALAAAVAGAQPADDWIIETVAGRPDFRGDGGMATAARLNLPTGVAVDGSGNLYIADSFDNRIRKVDAAGVITTVAGSGTAGYSGDGGAAVAARLNLPSVVPATQTPLVSRISPNAIISVFGREFAGTQTLNPVIDAAGGIAVNLAAFLWRLSRLYVTPHENMQELQNTLRSIQRHAVWALLLTALGFAATAVDLVRNAAGRGGEPPWYARQVQANEIRSDGSDIEAALRRKMERCAGRLHCSRSARRRSAAAVRL